MILPGSCTARAGRHRCSCSRQALVQAGDAQCLHQQQAACLGDEPGTVGGHDDLAARSDSLHVKSASWAGVDGTFDKSDPSRSKALFSCKRSRSAIFAVKARGQCSNGFPGSSDVACPHRGDHRLLAQADDCVGWVIPRNPSRTQRTKGTPSGRTHTRAPRRGSAPVVSQCSRMSSRTSHSRRGVQAWRIVAH